MLQHRSLSHLGTMFIFCLVSLTAKTGDNEWMILFTVYNDSAAEQLEG